MEFINQVIFDKHFKIILSLIHIFIEYLQFFLALLIVLVPYDRAKMIIAEHVWERLAGKLKVCVMSTVGKLTSIALLKILKTKRQDL